jgi:hypothetical protein
MFGALMIVDMLVFGLMAYNYSYVDPDKGLEDDNEAGKDGEGPML